MLSKEERERAIELYVRDVREDIWRWVLDGNIPEVEHFIHTHLDPESLDDDTLYAVINHHLDDNGDVPLD